MSFEGYYRYLCAAGHETTMDVYSPWQDEPRVCKVGGDDPIDRCGQPFVWKQTVDQTNGCEFEEDGSHKLDCQCGKVELEVIEPRVYCVCICGNVHTKHKHEPRYKIPDDDHRIIDEERA